MSHDPRAVDTISAEETVAAIKQADKIISCAWSVITVHRKSTDDWSTIIVFLDQDKHEFAHAFEIESAEELEVLAQRLRKGAATMRTLENKS